MSRSTKPSRVLPDAVVETALRSATRRGGRWLAWTALAAGPLLVAATLLVGQRSTPENAGPPAQQAVETPSGWAEMYVRAWLSAHRDDVAAVEAFYPPGMKTLRVEGSHIPVDTATLTAIEPALGRWQVTVAVNLLTRQPDGEHTASLVCVRIGLLDQNGYVATALPSPVACPATLPAPRPGYGETADLGGPVGQSVLGFLTGYLTGRGGLDRYVTPGSGLAAAVPPPFAGVRLTGVRTRERFEAGQAARPVDGTETRVLAEVSLVDATGETTPATYALVLVARAGRWEVARLDDLPLLADSPR